MIRSHRVKSQRLLRKGALVEETYALFAVWRDDETFHQNCERAFASRFATVAWRREVEVTLRSRFRGGLAQPPLVILARKGLPLDEWTHCLHLAMVLIDEVYWAFVHNWLFPEFVGGRYRVLAQDVSAFVTSEWASAQGDVERMTPYGVARTSRDLLRMARDLGTLRGQGPSKEFSPPSLTDRIFLFCCHLIAEHEGGASRVPASALWQAFLMDRHDVEGRLLHLHQFRKLDYQVAGSLVQLSLPCSTAAEFATRMTE